MPHHAVVPGPVGQVIGGPRTHGRAVAVGTRNTDFRALGIIDVSPGRTDIQTVALAWVDLGSLLIEAETLDPTRILIDPRILYAGHTDPVESAPDIEQERAIFGREGSDRMRPDRPLRQLVADVDLIETRRDPLAVRPDPVVADLIDLLERVGRPDGPLRLSVALEHVALLGFGGQIANGRCTLFCHQRAMLRAVDGIAALEHGRTGELGVGDLVVVEAPLLEQLVT